ncbi:Aldehyde oxidase/xanthine dehydrogenase, second molybdopterin binding domain [Dillenia turbinata]|uniref:Aldehyde oxidase/xanthine dehydrogenase, second molybdopterin binding domain n=1 Tax=Dillenia turbinata TaxID=194707 RepID=A0AAN8VMR5_9MAGN
MSSRSQSSLVIESQSLVNDGQDQSTEIKCEIFTKEVKSRGRKPRCTIAHNASKGGGMHQEIQPERCDDVEPKSRLFRVLDDLKYYHFGTNNRVPNASSTTASASSDMYGAAVLDACEQIKARIDLKKHALIHIWHTSFWYLEKKASRGIGN